MCHYMIFLCLLFIRYLEIYAVVGIIYEHVIIRIVLPAIVKSILKYVPLLGQYMSMPL